MDNYKHVHLERPNTLEQFLSEKEIQELVSLKITGFLGRKDFDDVLDDMCTVWNKFENEDDEDGEPDYDDAPAIRHLDLGEAVFVDGEYLPSFGYQGQLESLILPQCIKSVLDKGEEETCFSGSDMLKKLVFPEGVKSVGGFSSCRYLTGIVLPESVEEIHPFGFCGCESIGSIRIPATVRNFDGSCFAGCHIKAYELDVNNPYFTAIDGVIYTKDLSTLVAFPSAYPNNHFKVPETTQVIGKCAFMDSHLITIELPQSITTIEEWAFHSCHLHKVEIPDSVTEIGCLTFRFCHELEELILPNGLADIPDQMIGCCPNLHYLHIPASVKTIDCTNFAWSDDLRTVMIETHRPPKMTGLDEGVIWNKTGQVLIVPNESVPLYAKAPGWNHFIVKGQE